jgi:hypothetical protein
MNARSMLAAVLAGAPLAWGATAGSRDRPERAAPSASASGSASSAAAKALTCVAVSAEVRYGSPGYNHFVVLDNGCPHAVACVVSTDVAPEPIAVTVEPKTRAEVLTFRSSPASVFQPKVECTRK